MDRRTIAREWLLFLGALGVGTTVLPLALKLAFTDIKLGLFYAALLGGKDSLSAWMVAFAPYLLLQLVRSIMWAFNIVRGTKH